MPSSSKHPFLFVQESAKVWIKDDSVPAIKSTKNTITDQRPRLPRPEGGLENHLAFPLYLVRDQKGNDTAAAAEVWDTMLLRRLLHGGDYNYHLEDANPSKGYCIQLLRFHYDKLSGSPQYKFASYLRELLETEQEHLDTLIRMLYSEDITKNTDTSDSLHHELADAWQDRYDLLQYCLDWMDKRRKQLKTQLQNAGKEVNTSSLITGKVKTLAYLILIRSGLVPLLQADANRHAQLEYIVEQTGLKADTVFRYLKTKPGGSQQYLIYTKDNKIEALDYLFTLSGEYDKSALSYPLELRGAI
ncbi:hypothetical protein [Hymenobacter elongatus]|uniref:Uncharacterized protein n=1 Tax=Hymenobacter elongatus TaxID=877208 RepID=A0A4Z0PPM9_9BACT|nr:hypothetical protein [Hymenobacter elongatus]TGE18669.1 hypothetical protein E5J99_05025 [Hymenobacter elongatus]